MGSALSQKPYDETSRVRTFDAASVTEATANVRDRLSAASPGSVKAPPVATFVHVQ